ncbi:MAG: hypothetical protein HY820_34985 [Acidobacteria bacterium]|nr:hypothetical protein [Acidobacteriota bacterium]
MRAKIQIALIAILAIFALSTAEAKNRKSEKLYAEGKAAEARKEWDKALDLYEKAIIEDPQRVDYQMGLRRVRFQAGQGHVDKGQRLRAAGQVDEALVEFQKALSIDPSSSIADQEMRRTIEMIQRNKKQQSTEDQKALTPAQQARKENEDRIASMQTAPELRPIDKKLITLKMNNQPPRILFETICKLAGINVIFDSEYQPPGRNFFVDLNNATLDQALDFVAIQTKSFWKPLSTNTIFVTQDNVTKRRDYEDMVVKTFYLSNVGQVQELQEIATLVRAVTEVRRLFTYNGQYIIVIRGTADQVALAEKLIYDLDRPKSEVVVDVVVMEMSKTASRSLAASIANGGTPGLNIPVSFTPRNPVLSGTKTDTTTTTATSSAISLAQIGRISTNDFSLTLPGATFQALLTNRDGRVLQSPQLRAVEMQKASLRIGDKIPFASGSFQPGFGAVGQGISPLVSTQFQFAEVGVNVDMTPKVHGTDEVSLHIELELSTVRERIDIGGLQQPVIGQRKLIHDVRMREGEVSIIGGLQSLTESLSNNGFPGINSIPVLRRLFGSESKDKTETELVIALVPHIVRAPEITPANLRGISAGNDQVVRLSYAPREAKPEAPKPVVQANPNVPGFVPSTQATPAGPAAAPATTPEPRAAVAPIGLLTWQPASLRGKVDGQVFMALQVNNTNDLFAAPMKLTWDPKVVKLVEVMRGNALSPDGQKITFTPVITAEKGEARIEMSRAAGASGVNITGPLVMFKFVGVGKGSSRIQIQDLQMKDSKNAPIAASAPAATITVE